MLRQSHFSSFCRSELRWHAFNYNLDPSVVIYGLVDFYKSDYQESESVSDVVKEAPSVFQLSTLFGGPDRALEKERARRKIAESWGVWLWLVADFIPDGRPPLCNEETSDWKS